MNNIIARLKGKSAIVTGASSGIGLEFSRLLASNGVIVIMISNDTDRLLQVADDIKTSTGTPVFNLSLDLTLPDAPDTVVRFMDQNNLSPVLLINNAGIFDFKAVNDLSLKRIDTYINLHIRNLTVICNLIAARMSRQPMIDGMKYRGYILNMSSMSCWMPMPGIAMYSATKAYIRVLSRALRIELKPIGVGVMVACPGGIATDLFGLPPNLQKLGVKVGALTTPAKFVRKALHKTLKGKAQYINGLINRMAIVAVAMTPEWVRGLVKSRILDKLEKNIGE